MFLCFAAAVKLSVGGETSSQLQAIENMLSRGHTQGYREIGSIKEAGEPRDAGEAARSRGECECE